MTAIPSPIRSLTLTQDINGIPTTVTTQAYQDKILILVSQLGKIGSFIQASLPSSIPLLPPSSSHAPLPPLPANLPPPHPSTTLLPLMGAAPSPEVQAVYEMYVSQIAAIVWADEGEARRNVVVGIALKLAKGGDGDGEGEARWGTERERFAGVVQMVRGCRVW